MTAPADPTIWGTYEVVVIGIIGPVLLSTLPHVTAVRVPTRTLVVTEASDDDAREIDDVLRPLVDAGLEVVSVRRDRGVRRS